MKIRDKIEAAFHAKSKGFECEGNADMLHVIEASDSHS